MSTSDTSGELLQANNAPPTYQWGDRAARVRKLHMRYPELSVSEIARRADCTPQNASQVLSAFLDNRGTDELVDFQANKADIYDALQLRHLASITPEHLAKSSALQLVTAAAILEDKARLVRGQATSINVTALLDVAKLIRDKDGQ